MSKEGDQSYQTLKYYKTRIKWWRPGTGIDRSMKQNRVPPPTSLLPLKKQTNKKTPFYFK